MPVPLVATARLSRGTFWSNPEPDSSLQISCLPIASKQRLLICYLQAQASSQTPEIPAEDTCAAKIRFVTSSESNLLKEKARVMLFHQWCSRKTKAGLPKLQSCFILCVGRKRRLFQELLTKGECSPYPQVEAPEPCSGSAVQQFLEYNELWQRLHFLLVRCSAVLGGENGVVCYINCRVWWGALTAKLFMYPWSPLYFQEDVKIYRKHQEGMFTVTFNKALCSEKKHAVLVVAITHWKCAPFILGLVLFLLCVSFSSCNLDSWIPAYGLSDLFMLLMKVWLLNFFIWLFFILSLHAWISDKILNSE